ncbi:hypothetical protein H072_10658 [Dactylellina haptotyla CBS 200.50]|uniref:Uncharacterized protein n=1 Tax=Dactylellina haptotyla (strain CBS 200.50) TaxID=1284197 RepID=S8BKV1_DACHA|nr:hypothetical protein H072_10658 [Dactylellina haptotyla CBS 200.50]
MPARGDNFRPFADGPTAGQTGAQVFRTLRRPIVWVIIVGMVIAWYGVTGVTTAIRKWDAVQHEPKRHVQIYTYDGATYLPIVKEMCEPETQAWDHCFPKYSHKKRVQKCKHKIKTLENCAYAAQEAEKACAHSDPTLADKALYKCVHHLMHQWQ